MASVLDDLRCYSRVECWNYPGSAIISAGDDYCWSDIASEARPIQARALEEYCRLHESLKVLLRNQPADTLAELDKANEAVTNVIEQRSTLFHSSADAAFSRAGKALETATGLVPRLYSAEEDEMILVPDTNAVLHNPDLDTW